MGSAFEYLTCMTYRDTCDITLFLAALTPPDIPTESRWPGVPQNRTWVDGESSLCLNHSNFPLGDTCDIIVCICSLQ